jgi:hypothetical protein
LGLFVGVLGRRNSFILLPRGSEDLHLPSDLAGVVPLEYDPHRQDGNLNAAVGPACNKIKKMLIPGYGSIPASGGHDSSTLEARLLSRPHRLFFNPPATGSKRIVFGPNGVILEGNNRNEHSWRLFRKKLELLQLDGQVHSRFQYDSEHDRWNHTNDSDTLSLRNQFIAPEQ